MGILRWLVETNGFKAPIAGGGWTLQMQRLSDISIIALFLAFVGIPALFLVLGGGFFRERRIAIWVSCLLLLVAVMFFLQGLMSAWPAYRLLLLFRALAAIGSVAMLFILLPAGIAERHEHHLSRQEMVLDQIHQLRQWLEERKETVNHVLSGLVLELPEGEAAAEETDGPEPGPGARESGRPAPPDAPGAEVRPE